MIVHTTEKKAIRVVGADFEKVVNQYIADGWDILHMAAAPSTGSYYREPDVFLILGKLRSNHGMD